MRACVRPHSWAHVRASVRSHLWVHARMCACTFMGACTCVRVLSGKQGCEMKGGRKGGDSVLVEGMARTRERKAGK